jgi:hypothetical protein
MSGPPEVAWFVQQRTNPIELCTYIMIYPRFNPNRSILPITYPFVSAAYLAGLML